MTYKRLGDYIREVNVRNRDEKVTKPMGINIQRGFDLPSQDREDGEFPIYASTGIAEYHSHYKVDAPCVVTGRSGTIGEVFYVDMKCWPLNTTLWVKDFKGTLSVVL